MICVLYLLVCAWAKVFGYDLHNDDLMIAIGGTEVFIATIFAIVYSKKMFTNL